MNFDDKYFDNYGGPGTDYSQYFRKGSSSFRYVKDSVLGLCKPKTVYDIGCAYGDLLAFLDRQFHFDFLMGCDINKAACSRAQGLLGSKAKIYHTDVLKKNFRIPDQTPDFVIANILMYVPDNKVDIFFFNLHRLCSSFTLVCLLCIYDLYDGYWFVSEDGKVHNQENETDSDPYRVVNRPKQWWLYLFNKFNFKVVYEDKNGLFYLRKSDSFTKTFPFPIHFLSPREVIKKRMFNKISPFSIRIGDCVFYFYYHEDLCTLVEFGGVLSLQAFRKRKPHLQKLSMILKSGAYVTCADFVLRPVTKYVYVAGLKSFCHNNLFYYRLDPYIHGTPQNDREYVDIISEKEL